AVAFTSHGMSFLSESEFEAALAGRICERLHAPMIEIAAAVEDDLLDALFDGALRDQFSDRRRRRDIIGFLLAPTDAFHRTGGGNRLVRRIVDELRINMLA